MPVFWNRQTAVQVHRATSFRVGAQRATSGRLASQRATSGSVGAKIATSGRVGAQRATSGSVGTQRAIGGRVGGLVHKELYKRQCQCFEGLSGKQTCQCMLFTLDTGIWQKKMSNIYCAKYRHEFNGQKTSRFFIISRNFRLSTFVHTFYL